MRGAVGRFRLHGGILRNHILINIAALIQKNAPCGVSLYAAQLVIKKGNAAVQHKEKIISLRLHFGQPFHRNDGLLFQIGRDGIDIVLKRLKLVPIESRFRNIEIAEGHNNHDNGGNPGTEQSQPYMHFSEHWLFLLKAVSDAPYCFDLQAAAGYLQTPA